MKQIFTTFSRQALTLTLYPLLTLMLLSFTLGQQADMVFHNGAIYTVNAKAPWAEALAIKDGKLIYVGDDIGVDAYIGSRTEIIDLEGLMVMPGVHDIHMHPLEAGSSVGSECTLEPDTSPEDLVPAIKKCAARKPVGTDWLLSFGHSMWPLLESKRPPIEILDEVLPDRPAALMEESSHSLWVNSKALELAGIDQNTPDPVGGVIFRDQSGKPNGILLENAGNMVMDVVFNQPSAELEELNYQGLLYGLEQLAENGITSVADARTYWLRNYHKAWLRAEAEGTLSARAVLGLWAYPHLDDSQLETIKALYRNNPEDLLRISQIKLYSDGVIHMTTGAMLEPYLVDYGFVSGNKGINYFNEERLSKFITELEKVGFDFHIHAIGDRAVHESLNAIAAAKAQNGNLGSRHRLTHLEQIDPADRERFKTLGVIADFQVAGDFTKPEHFQDTFDLIGEAKSLEAIPLRSVYDTGAVVALSSDWDVSDLNPFVGMQHALSRGKESLPNLEAAIRSYTLSGAYAMRQETITGSLEVGKAADLIVIDQNLFEIPIRHINQTRVLLTMLAGEVVYESEDF